MDIRKLSKSFYVKKLTEDDLDDMLNLCLKNRIFYDYCPPQPTKENLKEDFVALPPNKTMSDKFFVGFYKNKKLVAICDLISGYPDAQTAFIGFFMVDVDYQGAGIGTQIISEILQSLKKLCFKFVQLAYVKNNPQSKAFWEKNGFVATGVEKNLPQYTKVVMQKLL